MLTVSVVVPATDAPATLDRCLAAIRRAEQGPDELIVVDGPSTSSAAEARNDGAIRSTGDVIVFVDADVEIHRDAFARIRAAYARDEQLTAVYGSYDDAPSAPGVVSVFRNLLHHHVHQAGAGPTDTFWTGLGAVRRRAFFAAGGFDAARYPYPSVEDIDLGRRLAAGDAQIVLDPDIQGKHLKAWTFSSMVWTDLTRRGIPWVALEWRHRRVSSTLNLGWRHRASAAACLAAVVGALSGEPLVAVLALALLLVLNRRFYGLLLRRQGPIGAAGGVALHAVHHLVAVVSLPLGTAVALAAARPWRRAELVVRSAESKLVE